MRNSYTRKALASAVTVSLALALSGCGERATAGVLGGADMARGHALRDRRFPEPEGSVEVVPLLIAGGGIAGLAAGWTLAEAGFEDFRLLELDYTAAPR